MIVGSRKSKKASDFLEARSREAIDFALSVIKASPLSRFVSEVYLYGSTARGAQRFDSDIDLFVELNALAEEDSYREWVRNAISGLRRALSREDDALPDIDIHYTIGRDWKKEPRTTYHDAVYRDGKNIWKAE